MTEHSIPDKFQAIAARAAREFLNEEFTLGFLGQGQSVACKVTAGSGSYLLRVQVPSHDAPSPDHALAFTEAAIESECAWMRALADETEIAVQRPIASPSGGHVLCLPQGDSGLEIPCTMLQWLDGEPIEGKRTPDQARQLGVLLASLQDHGESWRKPPGFVRLALDRSSWRASIALLEGLVELNVIPEEGRDLLASVVGTADTELSPHEKAPGRVGLIHSDLHEGNYLLHGSELRPIDFGRSGTGAWYLDLAECLGHLGPDRRRDMIEGYSTKRPLRDGDQRLVEGYFVGALVEFFGYHAGVPDDHPTLAKCMTGWSKYFERYVAGDAFLFEI